MTVQEAENVVSGSIHNEELVGGIDLYLTLASGQTYRWRREEGNLFDQSSDRPTPWYETVAEGAVIRVRQTDEGLEWEGSRDVDPFLRRLLRLDDDLPAILETGPNEAIYREAIASHQGMRLVVDSLYVGLISFICSTNMHVERIHQMVQSLMRNVGTQHTMGGRTYHAFPTPTQLADCSVETLLDCGLGYRAPYVRATAQTIAEGDLPLPEVEEATYEETRQRLTEYTGVGPKVADCALLFGAGLLEPVPLDRWIQRAIERHFPECEQGSYEATSQAIRSRLGPYPGYAQTYLFHHLRTA